MRARLDSTHHDPRNPFRGCKYQICLGLGLDVPGHATLEFVLGRFDDQRTIETRQWEYTRADTLAEEESILHVLPMFVVAYALGRSTPDAARNRRQAKSSLLIRREALRRFGLEKDAESILNAIDALRKREQGLFKQNVYIHDSSTILGDLQTIAFLCAHAQHERLSWSVGKERHQGVISQLLRCPRSSLRLTSVDFFDLTDVWICDAAKLRNALAGIGQKDLVATKLPMLEDPSVAVNPLSSKGSRQLALAICSLLQFPNPPGTDAVDRWENLLSHQIASSLLPDPGWLAEYLARARDDPSLQTTTHYFVPQRASKWQPLSAGPSVVRGLDWSNSRWQPEVSAWPAGAPLADIIERSPALIILGDPGLGKTTVLREQFQNLYRVSAANAKAPVPVLVDLSRQPHRVDPLKHVLAALDPNKSVKPNHIRATQRAYVLMFDSLDSLKQELVKDFVAQCFAMPRRIRNIVRVVITCTTGAWTRNFLHNQNADVVALEPFGLGGEQEVAQYVRLRFPDRHQAVLHDLQWNSPRVCDMARNPRLLSFICELLEDPDGPRTIPSHKFELLEQWISKRVGQQKVRYRGSFDAFGNSLLGAIARRMLESELVEATPGWIRARGVEMDAERQNFLRDSLKSGILASAGGLEPRNRVRFLHRIVQDYFAALDICISFNKAPQQEIEALIHHHKWDEPILMALERVSSDAVAPAIEAIYRHDPILAAEALSRCPQAPPCLGPALLTRIVGALDTNGRLNPGAFMALCSLAHKDATTRMEAVIAQYGEEALEQLTDMLEQPAVMQHVVHIASESASDVSIQAMRLVFHAAPYLMEDAVLEHAQRQDSALNQEALYALGSLDARKAIHLLRDVLTNPIAASRARGIAAGMLARHGYQAVSETVRQVLRSNALEGPEECQQFLHGLAFLAQQPYGFARVIKDSMLNRVLGTQIDVLQVNAHGADVLFDVFDDSTQALGTRLHAAKLLTHHRICLDHAARLLSHLGPLDGVDDYEQMSIIDAALKLLRQTPTKQAWERVARIAGDSVFPVGMRRNACIALCAIDAAKAVGLVCDLVLNGNRALLEALDSMTLSTNEERHSALSPRQIASLAGILETITTPVEHRRIAARILSRMPPTRGLISRICDIAERLYVEDPGLCVQLFPILKRGNNPRWLVERLKVDIDSLRPRPDVAEGARAGSSANSGTSMFHSRLQMLADVADTLDYGYCEAMVEQYPSCLRRLWNFFTAHWNERTIPMLLHQLRTYRKSGTVTGEGLWFAWTTLYSVLGLAMTRDAQVAEVRKLEAEFGDNQYLAAMKEDLNIRSMQGNGI